MTAVRARVSLALAAVAGLALLLRGCGSVAHAAEPTAVLAVDPLQLGNAIVTTALGLWLALEKWRAKTEVPPSSAHAATHLSREDVRNIAAELVKALREETIAGHARIRDTLAEHRAHLFKLDERADRDHRETAAAIAKITEAIGMARASMHELRGRLSTAALRED
jgi:hypothetical protein